MTGSTFPDGFKYETNADVPAVSLRAEAGTTLAEQVQAKFVTNDAAIASLSSRIAALEAGTNAVGWIPIQDAALVSTASEFTVDLTDGARFDVGEFDLVQLFLRFDLTATGDVHMQINADPATVYQWGQLLWDYETEGDSSLIDRDEWKTDQTSWRIGHGGTVSTNTIRCTIYHTNGNALHSFESTSGRQGGSASTTNRGEHQGSIDTLLSATPSSLRIFPEATTFSAVWWWAMGFRTP